VAAISAASLRAGTMTVIDGLPAGEMLCSGKRRSGMVGRPIAAEAAFQSQVKATSQAMSWRAICMGHPIVHFFDYLWHPQAKCGGSSLRSE
jgi:hypothetical protein